MPRCSPLRALVLLTTAGIVLEACGSDTSSPVPPIKRGLTIVSGGDKADTVQAFLPASLIVEVHDSAGALAPLGTVVRFQAVTREKTTVSEASVEPFAAASFSTFGTSTTDALGRAGVLVRLGTLAGTARVSIAVPALGLLDTARFTVLPGQGVRVSVGPRDTMVYAGKPATFVGGVTDQFGNVRSDPVTWTVSGSGAAISTAGVFTSPAIGRYTITATAATGTATAAVSVVPEGRLVGSRTSSAQTVDLVNFDGTGLKNLASYVDGGIGGQPTWMPDRASVIFTELINFSTQALSVVDTTGVRKTFFPSGIPNVTHQADPAPSANGQWLFFAAYDTRCSSSAYCLYRSRIDGSSPELLGTAATASAALRPAPSPDGSKAAISTGTYGGILRVFDVATRTVSSWSVGGSHSAWSPDGKQIAFISTSGLLSLVNPDGTGARALVASRTYSDAPISWTTDGKFILARYGGTGAWELVDTRDGSSLPLPFTTAYRTLAIR
jgi:hypothetical protein